MIPVIFCSNKRLNVSSKFILKTADKFNMDITALVNLCISVLKDIRVITAAILTIFFISLGNYVVRYRKRPPKPKKKKSAQKPAAAATPAPKPEEKPKQE